ncbi:tetratricopeptide repeat protein [Streptomyces griseorubiginosus]|uniref:tetratricopeptide repeat protein n=1 Tax=Streptomyces griseorubiginosus TaxID=67304 RepID=UPI001AD77B17|nr:tetratricopeptide repeat protein [Streptomyces griseorubiginosus]MBO4254777.1 tetratricopeptide repeat protein [Streptomyces griseorubiginosus]
MADLDTAGKVAGIVGTIAGVAGLGVSTHALKQPGTDGGATRSGLAWPESDPPPGLVNLPPQPSPSQFVGREEVLDRLDDTQEGPGGMVVHAVHGLGGIGKSTLAAHWATTRATDYYPIWWISADSPAALKAGLAALATALQPALSDEMSLDLEALQERAVQWLAAHHGWLVILDDVNDPDDIRWLLARVRGRPGGVRRNKRPRGRSRYRRRSSGRFLITSRTTGWRGLATAVPVDVLDQAEAVDLLNRILNTGSSREVDGADELCEKLGGLPLAIEQAAAYIVDAGITPRIYSGMLASYTDEMLGQGAEGTATERTIARIWHVTQKRMTDEPLTATILRVLAWYAPDAIPRTLLDGIADPPALTHAVGRLAAYSMLATEHNTLNMHPLVQTVARTPNCQDPYRQPHDIEDARILATTQLTNALPAHLNTATDWPTWRALLPHIAALADHAPPDTRAAATARLLAQTASFLQDQSAVVLATAYLERTLTGGQRLGEDHPATLTSGNNLASDYWEAVDLGWAVPVFERTLADSRRVFGEDDPVTLTSRNNLAGAYHAAGDLERAVPLYQQTLTDRERLLGEDHPATLTSRSNLAGAYLASGDLGRAIPLFEGAFTDSRRVLGDQHPLTEVVRDTLAAIRGT